MRNIDETTIMQIHCESIDGSNKARQNSIFLIYRKGISIGKAAGSIFKNPHFLGGYLSLNLYPRYVIIQVYER